jgi:hypothetical protein
MRKEMREKEIIVGGLILAFMLSVMPVQAVTDGWDNINPDRKEFPAQKILWTADLAQAKMELRDGAEGAMRIVETGGLQALEIVKTNGRGMIIVTTPPFEVKKDARLRAFAYCKCADGDPEAGEGYLRLYGRKEDLSYFKDLDGRGSGGPRMQKMVNAAPGDRIRKLAHRLADEKTGTLITAAIIISGPACTSRWSEWGVEDKGAADQAWNQYRKTFDPPDVTFDMMPAETFEARLAADRDHTARIRKVGDYTRLFIDGVQTAPVIFRGQTSKDDKITYAGGLHDKKGVHLQAITVRFGRTAKRPLGIWSRDGFDAKAGAEIVRTAMRLAPDSNFILVLSLDAYPEWVDQHSGEAWVLADGRKVYGHQVHADFFINPDKPKDKWYWPSYHSLVWREHVKTHIAELINELRRQGLLKRVIGVHLAGYHDAQFATRHPDFSPPAIAAFIEWQRQRLGEIKWETAPAYGAGKFLDPVREAHQVAYLKFVKQGPFHMQEDLARHIKRCFGKEIIIGRYCMGWGAAAFNGALDLDPFVLSDAIDYLVAQPSYAHRTPGVAIGSRIPTRTFHDHGKLFVNEFDLRTYGGVHGGESELRVLGLSHATDFAMWQTIHHKLAGQMIAQRMGWWYFDMSGTWFSPPEIVQDIADVNAQVLSAEADDGNGTEWRPSVAIAVDEEGMLLRNTITHYYNKNEGVVQDQIRSFASAGVPFDTCLADDFVRDPSCGERYKVVLFSGMYHKDTKRLTMLKHLEAKGVKSVFLSAENPLSPAEFAKIVRDAGGYVPAPLGLQVDMNGRFVSIHALRSGTYEFKLPRECSACNMKTGKRVTKSEVLMLDLVAGETRWYRLGGD